MNVARLWIILGVVTLLAAGALSVLITGAKIPFLQVYVTDLELVRRSLVVHVNLATLVWFSAIPVAITRLVLWQNQIRPLKDAAGFFLALLSILLMSASAFFPEAQSVLANYIPVLDHSLHDWGLGLFFVSVIHTFSTPTALFGRAKTGRPLAESRAGLWVGGMFFLAAAFTLALSYLQLSRADFPDAKQFFEVGMWGGGHLLQHSSAVFLLVCWTYLLRISGVTGKYFQHVTWVYVAMAAPLLMLPFILAHPPQSAEYRDAFTFFMRWGMFPPMLVHVLGSLLMLRQSPRPATPESRLALLTWAFSVFLALLGFVFGAFINGHDLRVPGHYHATIGAVTIAFLLVSYRLLFRHLGDHWAMKPAIWLYGIGQIFFSGGMFTAGAYGIGRKTYGSEHVVTNLGQKIGFGGMGVGGLIALVGGVLFGLAIFHAFRQPQSKEI